MVLSTKAAHRKDTSVRLASVKMGHMHFAAIAHIIDTMPSVAGKAMAKYHFADKLAATNPRFDRERFLAACNGASDPAAER